MKNVNYLLAGVYATYLDKEFRLTTFQEGKAILMTNDPQYQNGKFGFSLYTIPSVQLEENFYIKAVEITEITNAYELHYEAIYQGERCGAGVTNRPKITLFFSGRKAKADSLSFKNINKGEWVKVVDISEVELLTIKEPIDLSK